MKARIKTTGEILEVYKSCTEDFPWTDEMGDKIWKTEELMFLEDTDYIPDYWIRLEHQYAGMAMQGLMSREYLDNPDSLVNHAIHYAHALVEKMKEEK